VAALHLGENNVRVGRLFLAVVLCSMAAEAQTFNMGMETDLAAWNPCVLPQCQPGGLGIPTSYTIEETGAGFPKNTLKLAVSGPQWTNFLAWDKVGASTATYFNSDFWVLIPRANKVANVQALEYDLFQFLSPYEFMFGSECVIGAKWQIWDHLHGHWIDTALDCELAFGTWHHIQWWTHRIDGDVSCDGYPCMYYDMLGIDGVYTRLETTEPAGPIPGGWSNDSGLNFQLDISGAPEKDATITEYIKEVNFTELGD
jgi:hypothetical protein